jgi:hypothetical protein
MRKLICFVNHSQYVFRTAPFPTTSLTPTNVSLTPTASRLHISRPEVMRHLVLYHGLCGGDFPLTFKILALPATDRERIIEQLRVSAESGDPIKPQQFRE